MVVHALHERTATHPERPIRATAHRPTLVDPYREHLRKHRAETPAIPVLTLLEDIKAPGHTGSHDPLYRYTTQGKAESERSFLSPRQVTRLPATKPENLKDADRQLAGDRPPPSPR
jgi:hypothetical protein